MRHSIAGAAGHIDHGKTALVRALTGIDTDRLEEEKRRGISIDIGFAHMELASDVRLAFIDVPGHEKFIKNMLAGVAGIDFVVLAIAANESIKPQTREHFDICRLLGIRSGVVAVTKCDVVDEEMLEVVKLEIGEFVKESFLENAAIIPVSAITGQGLDALRAEMTRLARAGVSRDTSQYFRMPIDRSFVMSGFGAVVTGTVFSGAVHPEDEVQAYPTEKVLRIRGVQVHGRNAKVANAGQRAALNVTGASHDELVRGMTLAPKGVLAVTKVFDAVLDLLPSAKPLKNRAPIHLHSGTAEVQGEVRLLNRASMILPGARALVRIALREPLLLLPGDRFIVRMFSPVTTIAGGEVLDIQPPRRLLLDRARKLAESSLTDRIALFLSEAPEGLPVAGLVARLGLRPDKIAAAASPEIHRYGDWLIHDANVKAKLASWKRQLADFHRANPLLPGYNKEQLRSRDLSSAPAHVFEALLGADPQIVVAGESVRLASHKLALQDDERQASQRIEQSFEQAGLRAPSLSEVLQSSGVDPARARSLLQILLKERRLIRFTEDFVLHASAASSLKQLLASRKGTRFTVTEFKDWTGVSRKYAIPLMEWLDRERVTRRDGDSRLIL